MAKASRSFNKASRMTVGSEADARSARVMRGLGGLYHLMPEDQDLLTETSEWLMAKPRGIFRKRKIRIQPGDRVLYQESGDVDIPWQITELLPRKNLLIRPPVANLDKVYLCFSCGEPACDFLLLDKLILMATAAHVRPALLFTKADTVSAETRKALTDLCKPYEAISEELMMIGRPAAHYDGDDAQTLKLRLLHSMEGQTVAFCGPSGVGKSSLFNALLGHEHMEVGGLSHKLGRGRHTTRHVELIPFNNGFLIDTPGFSSLETAFFQLTMEQLFDANPDFRQLSHHCRFAACRHLSEPACAVKDFVQAHPEYIPRYRRYEILANEILESERTRFRS